MVKAIFFDVDTQIDFLYPAGALYVPGAEKIVERVAALNRFAAVHDIPVISTVDAHGENDPEFRKWPAHCVAGTAGQHKPASTLLERRVIVPNTPVLPAIGNAQQILLEKQALDCFTNVHLTKLLGQFGAGRYVVYGVVTEICVQFAAFGLLKIGRQVEVVTDAVKEIDVSMQSRMFAEFSEKGGVLTDSCQIMSGVYH